MNDELIQSAWRVRERAYAPYSQFAVGAALLCEEGQVFVGCNVENLSFGLTICAERVAIGQAIASGLRSFRHLVIVADTDEPISPCGACRQVLAEFAPHLQITAVTKQGASLTWTLEQLLPRAKTGILNQG